MFRIICHVERVLVGTLDGSNLPHLQSNNSVAGQVFAKAAVITEVIADKVSAEQPAAVSSHYPLPIRQLKHLWIHRHRNWCGQNLIWKHLMCQCKLM